MIQKGLIAYLKSFPACLLTANYYMSIALKIFIYPMVDTSGNTVYLKVPLYNNSVDVNTAYREVFAVAYAGGTYGNYNWVFGTGSTPTTDNDYVLESIIPIANGQITVENTSWYQEIDNNDVINNYVTTFINRTNGTFTFSEFGISNNSSAASQIGTTSDIADSHFLLWREALATPVSVPSGETFQITIQIRQHITGYTLPDKPLLNCGNPIQGQ